MSPADLLRLVAANGLAGAMLDRPSAVSDGQTWRALVSLVDRERLTARLMSSIAAATVPVSAGQAEEARAAHRRALDEALGLERLLLEATDALDDAGIAYRILDGPPEGSLALLVDSGQLTAAYPTLQRRGLRRRRRRGAAVADAEGHEIALHTRLPVVRAHGNTGILAWSAQPVPVHVDGRSLPSLPKEAALLHTAWRASALASPGRLAALRNLTELSLTVNGDLGRAVAFAAQAGASNILAEGVRQAWEEFRIADVVPLSVWARRQPSARRRRPAIQITAAR